MHIIEMHIKAIALVIAFQAKEGGWRTGNNYAKGWRHCMSAKGWRKVYVPAKSIDAVAQ